MIRSIRLSPVAFVLLLGLIPNGGTADAPRKQAPPAARSAFRFSAAQKAHRFFKYFRRWAEEDAGRLPQPDAVLCTGSSSMLKWKTIRGDLAPLKVIPRGFGGSTLRDMLLFRDFFARYGTRRIVVYEGDNDLMGGTTPEQFVEQCGTFVEYVRCRTPDVEFWFITPKPSPKRWQQWPKFRQAISLLQTWADTDPGIRVIDVASAMLKPDGTVREDIFGSDRLHMNSKGYAIWTRMVRAALLGPQPALAPIGRAGDWRGFDLNADGRTVARIRFGSNGLIRARRLERGQADGTLRFAELTAAADSGVTLGRDSFVRVRPGPADDPYPFVDFRVDLRTFDPRAWEKATGGPCPFHFLTLRVDDAQAIHHRGFLVPTPRLDPYPLLNGRQGIVASRWSHTWTWAPPFGACPIPLAGLWAPQHRTWAAWDFMEARLRDHSEKSLASAYCWKQGKDADFIALVAPFAAQYVDLRYPEPPLTLASHARLLWNTDLPWRKDPNRWVQRRLWSRYQAELPAPPAGNDMDWLPGYGRLWSWPDVPGARLIYRVPEKDEWESRFFEPGAVIPRATPGRIVDDALRFGLDDRLAPLRNDLKYLLAHTTWTTVNGERCAYWAKPVEGNARKALGRGVGTLRNIHGWGVADVLLAFYEHEPKPEWLEVIDGALNWTRYNICTRNDISDVPEAMFTIGWPGVRFCLRYWRVFRNAPEAFRRRRAALALDMARSLAYRYTTLFLSDNADDDAIDGTWLIEPNSGRPWTGMPCSNECCAVPDGLLEVYIETADPILIGFIRGMTAQWHLLYQDEDGPGNPTTDTPFTEAWGLFDDCAMGGRDIRAPYGGLGGFRLLKPVGRAKARVVCGGRAAAVFCRGGVHTDIRDYRSDPTLEAGFAFRIDSTLPGSFELDITAPHRDLSGLPVWRIRGGVRTVLRTPQDLFRPRRSFHDLAVRDVRHGDVLGVGAAERVLALPARTLPVVKARAAGPPPDYSARGFRLVDLRSAANVRPDRNWDRNDSWAPLPGGRRLAWGIPFFLIPRNADGGRAAVRNARVPLPPGLSTRALALFVSDVKASSRVTLVDRNGKRIPTALAPTITAWKAWPRWFSAEVRMVPVVLEKPASLRAVEVRNALLWAVTLASNQRGAGAVRAVVDRIRDQRKAAAEAARLEQRRAEERRRGYALRLDAHFPKAGEHAYVYVAFAAAGRGLPKGGMRIPDNAWLEYDVFIPYDSSRNTAGIDLTGGSVGNIRDRVGGAHPGRRVETWNAWVHRRISLNAVAGRTFDYVVAATDGQSAMGDYHAFFRDVAIVGPDGRRRSALYDNGPGVPAGEPVISPNGGRREVDSWSLTVVAAREVRSRVPEALLRALEKPIREGGEIVETFDAWPEGASGRPLWDIVEGAWSMRGGAFVGADCETPGWLARGAGFGNPKWTDVDLSCRFRIIRRGGDWRDGAWIGFRASRRQRFGYSLNLHARTVALHKEFMGRSSGDRTPLAQVPWTPDDKWHTVRIQANGSRVRIWLDGNAIMDVRDENACGVPPIPSGRIVLSARKWSAAKGHTVVAFDDLRVRVSNPAKPRRHGD
ncbi:MAG: hypothetical protein GXP31_04725 [Kiritimatiellaeota bacterium]|nr:hypothetical protein [Kiritimatiellota bacterium]